MTITLPSCRHPAVRAEARKFYMLRPSFMTSRLQGLPALVQALYIHIALRHNGKNNGQIRYSVRDGPRNSTSTQAQSAED